MRLMKGIVISALLGLGASVAAAEDGQVTILPGELAAVGARGDTRNTQLNLTVDLGSLSGPNSANPFRIQPGCPACGSCATSRTLSISQTSKIHDRVFTLALAAKVSGEELRVHASCNQGTAIINLLLLGDPD